MPARTGTRGAPRQRKARPTVEGLGLVSFEEIQPKPRYSAVATELSDFAAKLAVGQVCEAGCGAPARWVAVATSHTRWCCAQHIDQLLDHALIWFVHPVGA